MKGFYLPAIVACGLLAASCASTPDYDYLDGDGTEFLKDLSDEDYSALTREILLADSEMGGAGSIEKLVGDAKPDDSKKAGHASAIPVQINGAVQKWINYFTTKDRARFQRFLDRGEKYRPMVERALSKHNVPHELYYLAMIESGFVVHAASHANAVGIWQFIRATGRRYGLNANYYVDERRDPMRATEAAARHLGDLKRKFKSWYLAMAAYNAGPGRVNRAVRRGGTRNFWALSRKRLLPRETRNYVPKFLAALIIGKHPDKFGFSNVAKERYPDVRQVRVPTPVRLRDIARISKVSYQSLKKVNPHLRRGITPPRRNSYKIWVPKGQVRKVASVNSRLKRYRLAQLPKVKRARKTRRLGRWKYYQIRRGDTLASIARRHRTSIYRLKRINGLRSSRILRGKWLRVGYAKKYSQKQSKRYAKKRRFYRVRRGDSLYSISRKFGVSVNHIKRVNRMRHNRIYAGQSLRM